MMQASSPTRATIRDESAVSYRAQATSSLMAMQAASLPGVREKHRAAAERWLRMAQSAEALSARADVQPAG